MIGVFMHLGIREPQYSRSQSKQRWPETNVSREFIGGVRRSGSLITPVNNTCTPAWNANLTPVLSFKLDPSDVLSGGFDSHLTQLDNFLQSNSRKMFFIYWHEPENDLTPSQFTQAFARVKSRLNYPVGYSALSFRWRPGGTVPNPSAWLVDADFYAIDVYSGNSFPLSHTLEQHVAFQRWHSEYLPLTGQDKYWLTERGWLNTNAQGRADAIRREADWLKGTPDGRNCEGYIYWNSVGTENQSLWVLDSTHGEPAVRYMFEQLADSPPPPPPDCEGVYEEGYKDGYGDAIRLMRQAIDEL